MQPYQKKRRMSSTEERILAHAVAAGIDLPSIKVRPLDRPNFCTRVPHVVGRNVVCKACKCVTQTRITKTAAVQCDAAARLLAACSHAASSITPVQFIFPLWWRSLAHIICHLIQS